MKIVLPDKEDLSAIIMTEIVAQGNEIDNLGDGESIVLNDNLPTINVVELSEKILDFIRSKL